MSETKDRFGLTAERRAELLAEIDRDSRVGPYLNCEFLRDLYKVAKTVLAPPPLGKEVDFATALNAAIDGHEIEVFHKGEWLGACSQKFRNHKYRILPKPKPEPKWLTAEEAAVALLCKRQPVRCKQTGASDLLTWWYVPDTVAVRACNKDGVFTVRCSQINEFRPGSQWCIVNPKTGEPVEWEEAK